jgi:hypothetical protein
MSSVSSPRESTASSLYGRLQRLFHSDRIAAPSAAPEADSYRVEAAHAALAQAMSPAERVHAIHQAQSAGLPLHEIEQQLDWLDARAAAGVK